MYFELAGNSSYPSSSYLSKSDWKVRWLNPREIVPLEWNWILHLFCHCLLELWNPTSSLSISPLIVAKKIAIYNYNEILMIFEALTGIEPSRNDWVFLSMDDHYKVIFFGNIFDIPWKQNIIWIQFPSTTDKPPCRFTHKKLLWSMHYLNDI